jgi:hypothetical protein
MKSLWNWFGSAMLQAGLVGFMSLGALATEGRTPLEDQGAFTSCDSAADLGEPSESCDPCRQNWLTDDGGKDGCSCTDKCRVWTVDWVVAPMFSSRTWYQFGDPRYGYSPLSKLDWDINTVWTGIRFGVESEKVGIHFQWLTPMQRKIAGEMLDYDWMTPTNPNQLDSLTSSETRWNDGQMLELQGEFQLAQCLFGLPIELWPLAGFKFQRFNMTGYDSTYLISPNPNVPVGSFLPGDAITFNQQYYVAYFGGQLRSTLNPCGKRPITLTFQGDGGPAWGYNVDHHLLQGERYTMEKTQGGAFHFALIGEVPVTRCVSVGVQADYTGIYTSGTHHLVDENQGLDLSWDDGVEANSEQMMISAFVRAHF